MPRMVRITAANASTFYSDLPERGMLKAVRKIFTFFKGHGAGLPVRFLFGHYVLVVSSYVGLY